MKKYLMSAGVFALSPFAQADLVGDSHANLGLRNFYFNNDFRDQAGSLGQSKTEEWAQAFVLDFKSGYTEGPIGVGLDALGLMGVTLDSGDGRHRGSSMIPDEGSGASQQWSRLGLTPKLKVANTELRYGTLMPKLPYNVFGDFVPVASMGRAANVIVVNPQVPAKTIQELVALSKSKPNSISYASPGVGSSLHLAGELFKDKSGADIMHVAYKGSGQGLNDALGGTIPMLIANMPTVLPHVQSGKLRALAVTGDRRSTLAPNLPTVAESGLPGYSSVTWFGIYGPAGMKPELVARINQAFNRAIQNPEVIASLAKQGVEPAKPQTPAQFAAMVQADSARWAKVIRDNHITLE